MKHIMKFEVYEGSVYKANSSSDSDVKIQTIRKKVEDFLKSMNLTYNQIGNDFEVYKNDEYVAQIMFRNDYIGVKSNGNKFPKEFTYGEFGKVKTELYTQIK